MSLGALQMSKGDEAEMEAAMRKELAALSFITESLRAEMPDKGGDGSGVDDWM